jgi:apolipoprotein N-acyltransferase
MHNAAATEAPNRKLPVRAATRASVPTLAEVSLVIASALLLILSFPNFKLWPLAWIGLVPFLLVVAGPLKTAHAFLLGWLWGGVFFYGTCWWLSYPMIHYAHISPWLTYPLLVLPIALVAFFPALFSLLLSRLVGRFGLGSIFLAPLLWVSTEWTRYALTGQLWNALGYSQAFHPLLIQPARWGGVYMTSFLLLAVNVAVAFIVLRQNISAVILSLSLLIITALVLAGAGGRATNDVLNNAGSMLVIAVQPNVPMEGQDDPMEEQLLNRHVELSLQGLRSSSAEAFANRLVIWPESPMNFSYSREPHLRDVVTNLARSNHTLVLLNSLEPAANGGEHNSALLINEEGRIVAQYDKIRLMPFGEYVPLPHWLPGASSVRGIVGDFTPGSSYTLMPLGAFRAGVFICIEAAHPSIARTFANESADVLINISNDGYLGPTPVMQQHLANAIFRAVENDQQLLRVTNSGISAYIDSRGKVLEETSGFEETVRSWPVRKQTEARTFYTAHGDLFAYGCALISLGLVSATFITKRKSFKNSAAEARP